jgi:hypothetical protein
MTRIAAGRRTLLTGAALAVAGVLIVGCSSQGSTPAASGSPAATGSATAPASPTAPATPVASSGTGAAGSPSSSTGGSAGTTGTPGCTTADLKVTTGNYGGGTAGSYYSVIDFTNTTSAPCTLYGYPGVSLRDAHLTQIGAAATRNATPAPSLVTLAAGATASATLRMTDPTVYPTAECDPVTSAYLQVYPPNQTQAVELPFSGQTCSQSSLKILAVNPVVSGAA